MILKHDEENIEDAKYLEQAMIDSSKGHWVHGFEKHPDPEKHCTPPCKGIDGV